jgi:hypothetical protein
MRSYTKSDIYPTWTSGKGIHTDVVTGPCEDGQTYVRKYNKIGNIFGFDYVIKKDQYEKGSFGLAGSVLQFFRTASSKKSEFDNCFNYAYEVQNTPVEVVPEENELPQESYRPPNVGADVPVEFIIGGIIGVVTIIYAVK